MQKLMKRLHKNQKGFTLVELMVVVVIIGILVAIAIPIYGLVTANAQGKACHANQRTIDGAIAMDIAGGGNGGGYASYVDGTLTCPDGTGTTAYTTHVVNDNLQVNSCPTNTHDSYRGSP